MESLPRRAEAVIAAKGGPTSYWTLWIKNGMSLKFICESRHVSQYFRQYSVCSVACIWALLDRWERGERWGVWHAVQVLRLDSNQVHCWRGTRSNHLITCAPTTNLFGSLFHDITTRKAHLYTSFVFSQWTKQRWHEAAPMCLFIKHAYGSFEPIEAWFCNVGPPRFQL